MINKKISDIQTFYLLTMSMAITNHVIIIPLLLQSAKRDAWISVLAALIPSLLVMAAIRHIMKTNSHLSLIQWISSYFGRYVTLVIQLLFLLYILPMDLITLKDTTDWVSITFLPLTPPVVISGVLTVLCFFAAAAGLWSITVCAGILLPFAAILGFFVAVSNFQYKDYRLLTPVLENGFTPVLNGLPFSASGMFEIILFLLLQHRIKHTIRLLPNLIFVIVTLILMLGPLMGSIANFGPEEARGQRFPAYEQWRLVSIGTYISHLDFFSIFQWLSGSFIRISLSMYLVTDLFQFKKQKSRMISLLILAAVMLAVPLIPLSDQTFVKFLKGKYFSVSLGLVLILLLALLLFSIFVRRKEGKKAAHGGT